MCCWCNSVSPQFSPVPFVPERGENLTRRFSDIIKGLMDGESATGYVRRAAVRKDAALQRQLAEKIPNMELEESRPPSPFVVTIFKIHDRPPSPAETNG